MDMKKMLATLSKVQAKKPIKETNATPKAGKKVIKESSLKDIFNQLSETVQPGQKPLPVLDPKNQKAGMGFVTSSDPGIQNILKNLDPKDVQIVQAPGTQPTQNQQNQQKQNQQSNTQATGPSATSQSNQQQGTQTMSEDNLDEKWAGGADVQHTGQYSGKTVEQLKSMLAKLKKSGPHDKNSKEAKKMRQINFALRAKGGWKKGEGAAVRESEQLDELEVDTLNRASQEREKQAKALPRGREYDQARDELRDKASKLATHAAKTGVRKEKLANMWQEVKRLIDAGISPATARKMGVLPEIVAALDKEYSGYWQGSINGPDLHQTPMAHLPSAYPSDYRNKATGRGMKKPKPAARRDPRMGIIPTRNMVGATPVDEARGIEGMKRKYVPGYGKKVARDRADNLDYWSDQMQAQHNDAMQGIDMDIPIGVSPPRNISAKRQIDYRTKKLFPFDARLDKPDADSYERDIKQIKKAARKYRKIATTEAEIPHTGGPDVNGAGLGAGRSQTTLEAESPQQAGVSGTRRGGMGMGRSMTTLESRAKADNKAEKAGKKVTKDLEYDMHHKGKDDNKAEKAGKKVTKDIEYDEKKKTKKKKMKKKKLKESYENKLKAAHHMGKAHALAKHGYSSMFDEGSEEHHMYHEGYKAGLDECYGKMMPIHGLVHGVHDEMDESHVVDDMASFGAHTPSIEEDQVDEMDKTSWLKHKAKTTPGPTFKAFGQTFKDKDVLETDMSVFESWDSQLNNLLTEYNDINEGMSISVSDHEGQPKSVTVTATDHAADELMGIVKKAGLGMFGGDAGHESDMETEIPMSLPVQVGDHDGMMSLIKKMSGNDHGDYEDEAHDSCNECSMSLEECSCGPAMDESVCNECGMGLEECSCPGRMDEVQTEDQMMYQVAEATEHKEQLAEVGYMSNLSRVFIKGLAAWKNEARHQGFQVEQEDPDTWRAYSIDTKGYFEKKGVPARPEVWGDQDEGIAPNHGYLDIDPTWPRYYKEDAQNPPDSGAGNAKIAARGTAAQNYAGAMYDKMNEGEECPHCGKSPCECDHCPDCGKSPCECEPDESHEGGHEWADNPNHPMHESEKLDEWANDAGPGKSVSNTTFEQDIDFMTKVIAGGLNKPKRDQTTLPHTSTKPTLADDSMLQTLRRLDAIKK